MSHHVATEAGSGQAPRRKPPRFTLAALRAIRTVRGWLPSPPAPVQPLCANCVYFEEDAPVDGLEEYHDRDGACHFNPPVLETHGVARQGMVAAQEPVYGHATTNALTWCRCFRPGTADARRYVPGRGVV